MSLLKSNGRKPWCSSLFMKNNWFKKMGTNKLLPSSFEVTGLLLKTQVEENNAKIVQGIFFSKCHILSHGRCLSLILNWKQCCF